MTGEIRAVVVGAGPAGIRAAEALVAHGVRPVVIDEGATYGGQIYRRQPPNFRRDGSTLYGFEAAQASAVHAAMAAIAAKIDYRPRTLVWNAQARELDLLQDGRASRIAYTHLVVATGATDRVLPFPGWTLPGVFTLGGAQVALKAQGCAVGSSVAFAGTGPLLYLVACQYAKAGAHVAAVLDTAGSGGKVAALPALMAQPSVLAKGLYYVAWLRAHGVRVHEGVMPVRVSGEKRVSGVAWTASGGDHELACDAVAIGNGLRSETQLADLLDCEFRFDALARAHLPMRDAAGRSTVAGIYLAGDGAGILGADAAECAGERAALALLQDAGMAVDPARGGALEQRLRRIARFRSGLEAAFAFPRHWAGRAADELVICRCEQVTAGELRGAIHASGITEINRLKALTRVGMGRCQGRMCGAAACEVLAHACGSPIESVGRLRAQAPLKPIPFAAGS